MKKPLKIEICVFCGFVHRDDRTQTRQRKTHFHWLPKSGEIHIKNMYIHATVCQHCIEKPVRWTTYSKARQETPSEFYVPDSFNATLPKQYHSDTLDQAYSELANAMKIDLMTN